jgi:hypothetical protein
MTTLDRFTPAARAAACVAALLFGASIGIVVLLLSAPRTTAAPTPPIIIAATPTVAPPAMIAAYAAPFGAPMGEIPAQQPIRYRDSRAPGWVGVDWDGGVVWFQADGDAGALADLAPQPTAIPAPPVAQEPPAPQVVFVEVPAAPDPAPEAAPPTAAPGIVFSAPPIAATMDVADHNPHVANPSIRPGGPNLPSDAETERAERDQERCSLASVDDDQPGGAAQCAP